jgi:hypothetical protein
MARDPYRRQIRRPRRAMRKGNDPFQLVILGPDEPLGLIALAAAGRWAYRHRTAFVPFGITLAAFAVAVYAHLITPGTGYWSRALPLRSRW